MRILQLCHKPPLPKIDGGCVAISNISEGLLKREDVQLKILTVETYKHPFIIENYPKEFTTKANIEAVYIDTKVNFIDAYSSIITSDSYNVIRFFSPAFDKKLSEILTDNEFDIIHLESLFLTPYIHTIKRLTNAKIVLRAHNIEHSLWKNREKSSNFFRKVYLNHLFKKLKKYETAILQNVDAVVAISKLDKLEIQEMVNKPIHITPVGINVLQTQQPSKNIVKLFHIGAMDWLPNQQGIDWFIDTVWPKLIKNNKHLELHLAGKNISRNEYHLPHLNIYCHGEVENAQDFINKHDIMIVPLKIGSGIRIKILEAMSMGKVVVSSKVGINGIEAENEKDYLEANNTNEFIAQIKKATDEDIYKSISLNATNFITNNYKNETIINDLVSFYKSLL